MSNMIFNPIKIGYGIFFILMLGCSSHVHHDEEEHMHESEQLAHVEGDEVHLTKTQSINIDIQLEKIMERNLVSSFKLPGRVELPPNGKSSVSSLLDGNITEIYVQPGQRIRRGQRISKITNLEIVEWQQDYLSSLAHIDYLRKELKRQEGLQSSQLGIQKNYDQTKSELDQMLSKKNAIEVKLKLLGIDISNNPEDIRSTFYVLAPINGLIEKVQVSNGSYVEAKSSIVDIIDPDKLFIHFNAFEKDINKLIKGQQIEFYPPGNMDAAGMAEVEWISAVVDEQNNAYGIHAKITTPKEQLSIGQYVEGAVIDKTLMVPSLPLTAITQDKGLDFIFAFEGSEEDENHYKKIRVRSGTQHNGYFEVLPIDEIPENADIVVNGAYFLMSESKLGEMDAGHSH